MTKKYLVTLTAEERKTLGEVLDRGEHSAQKRKRAQALLLCAEPLTNARVAEQAGMHLRGVEELRKRFVKEGFAITLNGKPGGHQLPAIRGEDEARLMALVCSPIPDGYDHWTLGLLSERFVTLENKKVSGETIRRALKRANLNRPPSGS